MTSEQPYDTAALMASMGGFTEFLGLQVTELTGDRVAATWSVGPHLHQPFGIVHGGAHAGVVETLASIGGAVWAGADRQVVGVNNSTDFYRAVAQAELTAVATPIHRGRLQQVWVVEIHDEDQRLVARGQVRLQNLDRRS